MMAAVQQATDKYYKRDFWIKENLNYVKPHFRLEKSARIVNSIAGDKPADLLDVGCGPATLSNLVKGNVHYYGIDIAIHNPAANLIQTDFLQGSIAFENRKFDIVVAQGVFEYAGQHQVQKFQEIKSLLRKDGRFVMSYVNFNHLHKDEYKIYNNMQPFEEFRRSVASVFHIEKCFPTSHNWQHHEPNRWYMKALQMPMKITIPIVSRYFAVEYFLICS